MCTFEGSQEYFAYKNPTLSLSCILIILDDLPQLKSNDHDTPVPPPVLCREGRTASVPFL